MDQINWKDDVEFALVSQSQGEVLIPEPINYEDGNGNIYERDSKSKGFLTSKSNTLEFYGLGSDTLYKQSVLKGLAEDMLLKKSIKSDNRIDELWRIASTNYLDLGELEFERKASGGTIAKTKISEGGLKKIIDSRISDDFDLKSTTDADGNTIDALTTETITLEPREIFKKSVLAVEDGVQFSAPVGGGDTLVARAIPFRVQINSDSDNIDNVLYSPLSAASGTYANLSFDKIGNCFITDVDVPEGLGKNLVLNGRVKATIVDVAHPGTANLDIIIYGGGSAFTVKQVIPLDSTSTASIGNFVEFDFVDYTLNLDKGDSVAIGILCSISDGINWEVTETELTIEENSSYLITNAQCLTYKQVLNRLLYIITGTDNLVYSDLLTSGELSEDVVTNGFWIRQFPDVINDGEDEERLIQFTTKLDDVLSHLDALVPIAWWIETIDGVEKLRIELYSSTQQNFIGIPFAQRITNFLTGIQTSVYAEASEIKRKLLKDNFYSKIELGSEKGGDGYEEVHGLQSICGKATFATINNKSESVYSKLSPFRLGDYDVELPRRYPYDLYPERDTRYDSDIMCIRAKKLGSQYYLKRWAEIYETAPTGVYRVNSAYNLDITPARLLLKHSANISVGLYHYPLANIVFSSSNCNSSFRSKKTGEDLLEESGVIPHSRLNTPTIRPYSMECTAQVTQEIEDAITGTTNGVQNWFGLVAINTGTEIEYFRLQKSDVNKEGKHTFVEAYI